MKDALKEQLPNLACPECGGSLIAEEERVRCGQCDRVYPIVDDVLDFMSDE